MTELGKTSPVSMFPIGRTEAGSRAETVADHLSRLIANKAPGERLGTKDEIRAQAGVSIGTFNETLRLLQARSLVTVKPGPGGGLFVAEQSPMARLGNAVLNFDTDRSSIAEAVRIRNALEILIVEDAINHATTEDLAAMRVSLGRMSAAVTNDDGIGFLRANWQLHGRIAAVSPNTILHSLYIGLLDVVEGHTISVVPDGQRPLRDFHVERYMLHAGIIEAIADTDLAKATELVEQHNAGLSSNNHPLSQLTAHHH